MVELSKKAVDLLQSPLTPPLRPPTDWVVALVGCVCGAGVASGRQENSVVGANGNNVCAGPTHSEPE